jgi:hypothetical protein
VKNTVLGVLIAASTTLGSAAFAQQQQVDPESMAPPATAMPQPPPPPEAQQAAPNGYYGPESYSAPVAAPAPAGQWVYTNQYGWIWMPYGANYTYVTASDAGYAWAYYPRFGWRWVSAPWVVGYGPSPFWGRRGPVHFAWYGQPRFHGYVHVGFGRPGYRGPVYHAPAYHAPAAHVAWHGGGGGWRGGHRR